MQINGSILANAFMNEQLSGATVFIHPGTNHLFLQSIIYALISGCLTYNFKVEDYADQFIKGDMVILDGRTRCRFLDVNYDENIFTLEEGNLKRIIPLTGIYRIKIYEGSATTSGTRGIRKSSRAAKLFLEEWFGTEYTFTVRTQPYSILVVCNKDEAIEIVDSVIFAKGDRQFLFGELFPSAWFTSLDSWDDFPGNSDRARPVVMFTSRISIARDIIYYDREKKIRSVIVNSVENICSSPQELEDIIKRHSIHDITLLARSSYGIVPKFEVNDIPISSVYWSGQALVSLLDDLYDKLPTQNFQDVTFKKLIDNEIDRETVLTMVLPPFDSNLFVVCREALKRICRLTGLNSDMKRFAISAFGLLRLYEQSCFPISYYETLIKDGTILARLPSDELTTLNEVYCGISEPEIKEVMALAISVLSDLHHNLYEVNPKHEKLRFLLNNDEKNCNSRAIVVPKDSYISTVKTYLECGLTQTIDIYCSGKFDNDALYDSVIVSAVFEGKKYNPFRSNNAPSTIILGYPSEELRFHWLKNQSEKALAEYEEHNILQFEKDLINNVQGTLSDVTDDMLELEKKVMELMSDVLVAASYESESHTTMQKVIRLVTFENEEWALFTEHYSPYVFDEKTSKIIDGDVGKLSEGDLLIFATRNDITDFVDIIMDKLVPSTDQAFQECYRKSRYWKTVLREYMGKNNLSYLDVARKLEELGHLKHQVTIKSWLNEDSRIIGPRDEDSFVAIELVTGDNDMSGHSSDYCKACDEVRSMRIRILHYVENQIIQSYAGSTGKPQDNLLASIIGDAKNYTRGLRIVSITPINREVPISLANRLNRF